MSNIIYLFASFNFNNLFILFILFFYKQNDSLLRQQLNNSKKRMQGDSRELEIDTQFFDQQLHHNFQYNQDEEQQYKHIVHRKNASLVMIENIIHTALLRITCIFWEKLNSIQVPAPKEYKSSFHRQNYFSTPSDVAERINSHIYQLKKIDRAFSNSTQTKKKRPYSDSSRCSNGESRAVILKEIVEKLKFNQNHKQIQESSEQRITKKLNRLEKLLVNIKKQHQKIQHEVVQQNRKYIYPQNNYNKQYNQFYQNSRSQFQFRQQETQNSKILFNELDILRRQLNQVKKINNKLLATHQHSQQNSREKSFMSVLINNKQLMNKNIPCSIPLYQDRNSRPSSSYHSNNLKPIFSPINEMNQLSSKYQIQRQNIPYRPQSSSKNLINHNQQYYIQDKIKTHSNILNKKFQHINATNYQNYPNMKTNINNHNMSMQIPIQYTHNRSNQTTIFHSNRSNYHQSSSNIISNKSISNQQPIQWYHNSKPINNASQQYIQHPQLRQQSNIHNMKSCQHQCRCTCHHK